MTLRLTAKPQLTYAGRMERHSDTAWLIWSNKRGCWYRPESRGYTLDIAQAGVFDKAEAAKHYDGPEVPRRFRDTEPFPISAARRHIKLCERDIERTYTEQKANIGRLRATRKALTLWQPWASLIVAGAKPFEFRGWKAPRSVIGQRLVIHASARPMRASEIRDIVDHLKFGGANAAATCLHVEAALELLMPLYHFKKPVGLPLSAGLGTAILGEPRNGIEIAVQEFGFPQAAEDELPGLPGFDSDRSEHANWGWPLTDIEKWDEPQPMRGAQGLWNWPGAAQFAEKL